MGKKNQITTLTIVFLGLEDWSSAIKMFISLIRQLVYYIDQTINETDHQRKTFSNK